MIIPNLDFGGAQRSFSGLANALSEEYRVSIVVFNTLEGISFKYNCKILDLKIPAGRYFFSKLYYFIKRCRAINRIKKKLAIHTTISYLEGANYVNALTGSDRKVLSVRGSKYYDENIRGLMGWVRRSILIPVLYQRAHFIVALNNGIRKELVEKMGLPKQKVGVIRNFYDVNSIRRMAQIPLDIEFEFLQEVPYMVYAGRLAAGKGLCSIIDVFNLLKEQHAALKLVVVGDGPLKQDIIGYARRSGCKLFILGQNAGSLPGEADVLFLGYQENPYRLIKKAEMLIIASSSEGGPNILMESLICGTMVVSTDCPYGPGEQLAPELNGLPVTEAVEVNHGVLVPQLSKITPEHDLIQWSRIINRYLENPEQRSVVTARAQHWIGNQSPDVILENWKKVI